METNLLDRMLNTYLTSQIPITITLQNKIRVSGRIRAFDSYIIMIEGQKREIIYRHAMSSLAAEEPKKASVPLSPPKTMARTPKTNGHKPKQPQAQTSPSPSSSENSINNSMKEGLLRWMQEQKAAK